MDIVNSVLNNENPGQSTTVHKEIDAEIDEGTLLISDYSPFDSKRFRSQPNEYLKDLTRDNVQLLINKIWTLPTERQEETIVVKLPSPKFILPRARRVPKPKPLTKWQQFAKEKGIRSGKKDKTKVKWDEELRKWIPSFGYQRVKAAEQKEWLVELGANQSSTEDPFATANAAKKERQAKNELQRLRNIARAKNVKLPKVGLPSTEHFRDSRQVASAVTVARVSTASVGKFQRRLPKEKDAKEDIAREVPGMKRKREPPPKDSADEKRRNASLVNDILLKKTKSSLLNVESSIPSVSAARSSKTGGKKKPRAKSGKKPKGGQGNRDVRSRAGGRKRRHK
ncbi:ribosome biogenesis regulatory protein homolog [Orussus abietinus]|uniref:ribosome biogenesis regulatory protein homolog n=1 Tax=Orussus abietinus TaxID=222816 RepID=UPI000625DC29|nr:ribosome biogenesis regulatory protein homolog [Orussus abietinus]